MRSKEILYFPTRIFEFLILLKVKVVALESRFCYEEEEYDSRFSFICMEIRSKGKMKEKMERERNPLSNKIHVKKVQQNCSGSPRRL